MGDEDNTGVAQYNATPRTVVTCRVVQLCENIVAGVGANPECCALYSSRDLP
ncbi:hypothetical protein L226DRAFT_321376 [Lentinus tigrinus ALCF2SS1-7]|uniref:uncharacterized protein n=1 Tax=Lentinus tigrinus ALCF2SS1-7 TaxID=1328758 RepID=UPI0011660291|nr:hypothetical protein L226DRAFT_321376 [Lentinus tigrinus ALCF2SS1-7]